MVKQTSWNTQGLSEYAEGHTIKECAVAYNRRSSHKNFTEEVNYELMETPSLCHRAL